MNLVTSRPGSDASPEKLQRGDEILAEAWRELIGHITGFRRTALLLAATELGVLELLTERSASAAAVSESVGVSIRAADTFLKALTAIGLLSVEDGQYCLKANHRALFEPGPKSVVPNIMLYKTEVEVWFRMSGIMRGTDSSPIHYSRELFDSRLRLYSGIEMLNRLHAERVLQEIEPQVTGATRILDMGGGEGYYAGRILALNQNANVTILDLEGGFEACRERHAHFIEAGRLVLEVGDARTYSTVRGYDLVMMHELLEMFDTEEKGRIVASAMAALRPGGWLVITKFRLSDDGLDPASSALFSMRMWMKFREAYLESDSETEDLVRQHPISDLRRINSSKTIFVAQKAG